MYEVSWGDRERQQVYSLLHIEENSSVLALTTNGIFSFETEISKARLFDNLEIQNHQNEDFGGLAINIGTVVPAVANLKRSEVWVCSHAERRLFVLNPYTLSIIDEVEYTEKQLASLRQIPEEGGFRTRESRYAKKGYFLTSIKDLCAVQVNHCMKLGMADNWLLLLWDVEKRKLESVFDCREYYKAHLDKLSGIGILNQYTVEPLLTTTPDVRTHSLERPNFPSPMVASIKGFHCTVKPEQAAT